VNSPASPANSEGFIRTLLGDLPASTKLGPCDAHEHVVMRGPWLATHFPEFVLADVERALVDLQAFRAAGGGWVVDSMPTGAGRDATLLAEAAQRSGVPIVCPTGVHQTRYYPPDHPLLSLDRDQLADRLVQEITHGIDDGTGRLEFRAGVVKVASEGERLTNQERERFAAAARAQQETGCPILTHTQADRDALEQVSQLVAHGAALRHVVLSHCDKNTDVAYHRELLQSGVGLEYDQHFRQLRRGERCATIDLIIELIDAFPEQLLVGMDMARQKYWKGYGGEPGLAWMMTELLPSLRRAGLSDRQIEQLSVTNPAQAFAFHRIP